MKPIPQQTIDKSILQNTELQEMVLADPEFWKQSKIDLLLGSDVYSDLILYGVNKNHPKGLLA